MCIRDRVGTKQKILVDMSKDNFSLGRTYRDSPTVDNYVKINTNLETGKFYNVKIEKALEYDLVGQVVKWNLEYLELSILV